MPNGRRAGSGRIRTGHARYERGGGDRTPALEAQLSGEAQGPIGHSGSAWPPRPTSLETSSSCPSSLSWAVQRADWVVGSNGKPCPPLHQDGSIERNGHKRITWGILERALAGAGTHRRHNEIIPTRCCLGAPQADASARLRRRVEPKQSGTEDHQSTPTCPPRDTLQ